MAVVQAVTHIPGGRLAEWVGRADFAVLPLGSVEWHGPHLALGTDLILTEGFAGTLDGEYTAVAYPPVTYAACPGKTRGYAGTVPIRPSVALDYLCDVLDGILQAGFVRVLLLNAHDANMSIARAAMEWVSGKHTASLLLVNWWQLVTPAETDAKRMFERHSGRGHGGPYETAAAWAFAHDAVELALAPEIPPRPPLATDRPYVLVESAPTPWDGYAGYVRQASLEKGEQIVRQARAQLATVIRAWLDAPLPGAPTDAGAQRG
ncbi:MAG TPA: creatininase family protein [bacterium]|nr:creatininase family protein [bacterium]